MFRGFNSSWSEMDAFPVHEHSGATVCNSAGQEIL